MAPIPAGTTEDTYQFVDSIKGGNIPREFIPAVDKGFREAVNRGTLIGFPIVNVKMELEDGSYHDVDSSEMAFRICAIAAFRQAYEKAKPTALEPIMKLQVSVPEEYQGNVLGGINQRRGIIQGSTTQENFTIIDAEVPLSEMFGYSTVLRSATQGKGEFTMEFSRYAPCPRNIQDELVKEYQKKREAENAAKK
jgi:elongation factor G